MPASQSTPDLRTTQASTTAGTTWRSGQSGPRLVALWSERLAVSNDPGLPPLVQSQNQRWDWNSWVNVPMQQSLGSARPDVPKGGAAAIDGEFRPSPASLRTNGSQGTL
eukprot:symbB.v1.2.019781.t1/scaffold1634.1/size108475/9